MYHDARDLEEQFGREFTSELLITRNNCLITAFMLLLLQVASLWFMRTHY